MSDEKVSSKTETSQNKKRSHCHNKFLIKKEQKFFKRNVAKLKHLNEQSGFHENIFTPSFMDFMTGSDLASF